MCPNQPARQPRGHAFRQNSRCTVQVISCWQSCGYEIAAVRSASGCEGHVHSSLLGSVHIRAYGHWRWRALLSITIIGYLQSGPYSRCVLALHGLQSFCCLSPGVRGRVSVRVSVRARVMVTLRLRVSVSVRARAFRCIGRKDSA